MDKMIYNGTKQAKIRMVATALGWNSESINYDTGTYNIHLYGQSYVQPESTGIAGTTVEVDSGKLPSGRGTETSFYGGKYQPQTRDPTP